VYIQVKSYTTNCSLTIKSAAGFKQFGTKTELLENKESGAGDGNRTNPNEPKKGVTTVPQFNWSQMESNCANFPDSLPARENLQSR